MKHTGYNGWKNKETWLVNLWLGDCLNADAENGFEIHAYYVEQMVDEMASALLESPDANGFLVDLLNCALGEIDYREIAAVYAKEATA